MPKPAQVRRQAQEAEDLIRTLNTPPGDPNAPPADPAQPPAPPAPDQPPAPPAPPTPPAPPAPQPVQDEWKHKYDVLQGKYEAEMARMNMALQNSNERISSLEQLLASVRAAPPAAPPQPAPAAAPSSRLVTEDDRSEYGQGMVDFVGRVAKDAFAPERAAMQATIDDLRRQVGQNTATVVQTAQERMFTALDTAVPDWRVVNSSPTFLAWLKELDVFSGRQRHELLLEAYEKNDAVRVQRFFQAFKQEDSATDPTAAAAPVPPRTPAIDPATLVAPGAPRGGGPGADAPGAKKIWSQPEIADFYDRKRRGKVPADEAARLERDILLASSEGRVR